MNQTAKFFCKGRVRAELLVFRKDFLKNKVSGKIAFALIGLFHV